MLLESLTVCDFGVFRGQHIFELAPKKKYGVHRSVVLVGGLNGAGKTTLLAAVRVALYGRQSLGFGAAQKAYEEFLGELIHQNKHALVPTNAASVALEFSYSQLGRKSRYNVSRSWVKYGNRVDETLHVARNGEVLRDLSPEQAQAFLNQLIPIGVSELFFFDGEKIARLASDNGEAALSSSIRRLLGLDVLDKLKSDLSIYARQKRNKKLSDAEGLQIAALQQQLETAKQDVDGILQLLHEEVTPAIRDAVGELDCLEGAFKESGGAWAASRDAVSERISKLITEKERVAEEIREYLAGVYPLALAGNLPGVVLKQLAVEQAVHREKWASEIVNNALERVTVDLKKTLSKPEFARAAKVISKEVSRLSKPSRISKTRVIHGLGDRDAQHVMSTLRDHVPASAQEIERRSKALEAVEHELAQLANCQAQIPADETLATQLERIKKKSEEIGQLRMKKEQLLENARAKLWSAIDINRKMRKLEEMQSASVDASVALDRAGSTIGLLEDFSGLVTKRKVEVLRQQFIEVFTRLARKDDLVVDASIDDKSFEVLLFGKHGERVPKQSLSAGEKQVYAIAMLEALARTSGRNLPVIIDTPLGRLDSEHRRKLVNNYFPRASHQVIILSTDTEVDQIFYRDLSPNISHAFHLVFNQEEGMTEVEEGYFWKHHDQELRYAS